MPPIYDASCRALLDGQEDQSILISGVSGAGKTETAKLLLGHLASVAGSEEGGPGSERIQHMVECTVVLESFGNAVMVREFSMNLKVPRASGTYLPQAAGRHGISKCRQVALFRPHFIYFIVPSTNAVWKPLPDICYSLK